MPSKPLWIYALLVSFPLLMYALSVYHPLMIQPNIQHRVFIRVGGVEVGVGGMWIWMKQYHLLFQFSC